MKRWMIALLVWAGSALAQSTGSQESAFGISVPVTASGAGMYTERLQSYDPQEKPVTAGFRAVLYPTVKLGSHWFGYAAVELRESPYYYYDAYDPAHEFYTQVIQAFLGYSVRSGKNALVIKAGRLATAFGSFPLRYDDAENPVLDQPLSYITQLPIRADQIPCGVRDLQSQSYGYVENYCGGAAGYGNGLVPVTLYAIPGIEADFSSGKFDARVQLTSGSPANPQNLAYASTYRQVTGGGGYTIRQGFRVGASAFRGPWLGENVAPLLPVGTSIRSFPASGIGLDAQWARGRWSVTGEWQRFWFDSPNFTRAPSFETGYGEVKSIITPRIYLAARLGWLSTGAVRDTSGVSAGSFAPAIGSYELGGGLWLGRNELLKASYELLHLPGYTTSSNNVLGVEFVMRFDSLAWSFR